MQIPKIRAYHATQPVVAELWSHDSMQVFRVKIYGYERPDDDWLKVDLEYITSYSENKLYAWEYSATALRKAVGIQNTIKSYSESMRTLLWAPYSADSLELFYQREIGRYTKRRRDGVMRYRLKRIAGFSARGSFESIKFEFRTTWFEAKSFMKQLEKAAVRFPIP